MVSSFSPNSLNPYLMFEAESSMLNSGGTPATFLQGIQTLNNLASGNNARGNAAQATLANQPTALPLVNNEGYLYLSGVTSNFASIPDQASLDITTDIDIRAKIVYNSGVGVILISKYAAGLVSNYQFNVNSDGTLQIGWVQGTVYTYHNSTAPVSASSGSDIWVRATLDLATGSGRAATFYTSSDGVSWTQLGSVLTNATNAILAGNTASLYIGQNGAGAGYGAIGVKRIIIYASLNESDKRLDIDFASKSIAHNATSFACSTGQTVTINQSGQNPATIIKYPVFRFDGVSDSLEASVSPNITSGHAFIVAAPLGNRGEQYGRLFTMAATSGSIDYNTTTGFIWSYTKTNASDSNLTSYYNSAQRLIHTSAFTTRVVHDIKLKGASGAESYVNNAGFQTSAVNYSSVSCGYYTIGRSLDAGSYNVAMDVHALYLFPASISSAQRNLILRYINQKYKIY